MTQLLLGLLITLAVITKSYAMLPILMIIGLIHFLIWNDRLLPKRHRLSSSYYSPPHTRRFLITGAASGVGRHLVGSLLQQGHWVCATDVNFSTLQDVMKMDEWNEERVILYQVDVTKYEDWKRIGEVVVKEWDGIDVLMNIAGVLKPGGVLNMEKKDVDGHVDVNVKGVMFGTIEFGKIMSEQVKEGKLQCGGHIVNIASLGAIAPVSGVGLYIATKAACRSFSLCAAKDLFDSGVYVTVVCPDAIETPMIDLQMHFAESNIAFSGNILTLDDVERVIFQDVLPHRPREVLIPTSFIRGKMARMADVFSGSLLIAWSEDFMRTKGMKKQAERLESLGMKPKKSSSSASSSRKPSRSRSVSPATQKR